MSIRHFSVWAASVALVCLLVGIWTHSTAVQSVEVTPVGEGPVLDDGVLGGAPDLRVDLRADGAWVRLRTFDDKELGAGRRWDVEEPVVWSQVTAVRLMEDDPAGDDLVEEVRVEGPDAVGETVRFTLETGRDLGVGVHWFLWTPVGIALVAFMVLSVAFVFFLPASLEVASEVLG